MPKKTGIKQLSDETWYGPGYCCICGDGEFIPRPVRYWDQDDGWKIGVLCDHCWNMCKNNPPHKSDKASKKQESVSLLDLDTVFAEYSNWDYQ